MPVAEGSTLAHFRITAKLGEGGMGEVYGASDERLGRDVAIKVLPEVFASDPDRMARFEREARVLASLNHPSIAGIYEVGEAEVDGTAVHYLVMELAEGENLSDRLSRGPIPFDQAIPIARRIAEALDAAHERGIIHRDLKPANVKITAGGDVKLLDFGLAKALEGDPAGTGQGVLATQSPTLTAHMTGAGVILGTAAYMSPEQARGKPADRRSDIWSFGCVLFEMLTGRRPFGGETMSDVLASVLKSELEFDQLPPDTPAAIRRLLRRCLRKDPHHRLHDAADARIVLEEAAAGGVEEAAVQPAASQSVFSRRTPLLMTAAALAAAAVILAITRLLPSSEPPEDPTVFFPIPAPPGTRLEQVDVSPDGTRFALVAESGSGVTEIWVRDLTDREARRLKGTEGARDLFWSPDSRFVGYFTAEYMWKVDAETSDAVQLAAISTQRGASWNDQGVIVIGGPELGSVSAAGGEVVKTVGRDIESGENAMRFPHFLPDGKNVLFYSRNAESPDRAGLWVVELENGTRKLLTSAARSSAVYVESGELLYRRDRYLVARPFDTATLEFTGDYEIVDEDLWFDPGVTGLIDVSASRTGTVTYRTGGPELADLAVFDREGGRLGTLWEPKSFLTIGLAPGGQQLLTSFPDRSVDRKPWLYDLATASARQLEAPGDLAGNAIFSDDGGRAVMGLYTEAIFGSWMAELTSGAPPRELQTKHSSDLRGARPYDWHRDKIVYEGFAEGASSLNVLDLASGEDHTVVKRPGAILFGAVSPDGRWMAYSSDETGQWQVYVTSFPDGERRWRISTASGHQPRWNPLGGELFFLSSDRRMMSVRTGSDTDAFQWDAPQALFQTAIVDLGPHRECWGYAITPDGERFIILTRQIQSESPAVAVLNWR